MKQRLRTGKVRARLLQEWAKYLGGAAQQGSLTRNPLTLRVEGIIGPRAGALEIYAGLDAAKLLSALSRNDAALLRQFVPWSFTGEPVAYMSGRFVRVEAGWPPELAENMIRLDDLGANPKNGGRWVAGKNERGLTVVVGLSDKTPHYLVSGQTGSGKSVALRSAVLQLAKDPHNQIALVDGKMGEGLGNLQHVPGIVGPAATDGPTARAALGWACCQMRERYTSRDHSGRVIVVVDEFQELVDDPTFTDLFRKLAAQGRAAGVHLLAATQHPTVDAFGDATIRRNLVGKVALKVADPDASRVAVGGRLPRADHLLGAGDAYAIGPGACHRVQMAFVDERDIVNGGEWAFDEWPELEAENIGQDLPGQQVSWSYTGTELAVSIVSAINGEGRPKLVKRLQAADLGKPGAERAIRLLALGRECKDALHILGYRMEYVGTDLSVCPVNAHTAL